MPLCIIVLLVYYCLSKMGTCTIDSSSFATDWVEPRFMFGMAYCNVNAIKPP